MSGNTSERRHSKTHRELTGAVDGGVIFTNTRGVTTCIEESRMGYLVLAKVVALQQGERIF